MLFSTSVIVLSMLIRLFNLYANKNKQIRNRVVSLNLNFGNSHFRIHNFLRTKTVTKLLKAFTKL
jgi:hypothetical protein